MTEMEMQISKLGLMFTTKHSNMLTTGKFVNSFFKATDNIHDMQQI